MPEYEVTDNKTGKTYIFTGDSAPTEAEIISEIGKIQTNAPGSPPAAPGSLPILQQALTLLKEAGGKLFSQPISDRPDEIMMGPNTEAWNKEVFGQLPIAGMMTGAATSAPLAPAAGPFAPAVPIIGAILGGLLGESGKQATQGTINLGGYLDTAKTAAETEMFGPFLNKILSPLASRMTPGAQEVNKLVTEKGLPISPNVVNPSLPAKAMQTIADKAPVINLLTNRYRGKLQQGVNNMAQTARVKYSTEALAEMEQVTSAKYDIWLDSITAEKIPMENTLATLRSVYENLPAKAKQSADIVLASAGEGTELPIAAVKKLKNQLGTIGRSNMDTRTALNEAMREDISQVEGGKEAVDILSEADQVYRLQKVGKKINDLFRQSMKSDGITENFMPLTFEQKYTPAFRKSIIKDAGDIVPALDELLTVSKAVKEDISKLKGFDSSKYMPLINLGAMGGSIGALFYDPDKAAWLLPIAGGLGMSKSLMSPTGFLRKGLTSGFQPGPLPAEVLKLGGREVMMGRE